MLGLPAAHLAYLLHAGPPEDGRRKGPRHTASTVGMCEPPLKDPSTMRAKDLKAELDKLGVSWRGVCCETEDLARALTEARLAPPASAPPTPPPASTPSPAPAPAQNSASSFSAVAQAETEAAEVNAMAIEEIKAELVSLGADDSELGDDKAKLVSELLNARAFARPMFDTSQLGNPGGETKW